MSNPYLIYFKFTLWILFEINWHEMKLQVIEHESLFGEIQIGIEHLLPVMEI